MLINADLGPHNTVWRDGRPGLFDFNDLGWGYAGFDFARYLHGLRWRESGDHLVQAAVDGYASVRPLPRSWTAHGALFEVGLDSSWLATWHRKSRSADLTRPKRSSDS